MSITVNNIAGKLTNYFKQTAVNPLHQNISMHILHTVLHTFPDVLARRICVTIKSFDLHLIIIFYILMT